MHKVIIILLLMIFFEIIIKQVIHIWSYLFPT